MAYWLIKSEPSEYGWADLMREGRTVWDGVTNAQAMKNLRAMRKGEQALFYETGAVKAAVGICRVVKASPEEGRVEVSAVEALSSPVTLALLKSAPKLGHLALVRQPRLSVVPIDEAAWELIRAMAGK